MKRTAERSVSPSHVDCPHAAQCAGCPLIELGLAEQLTRKRDAVHAALERFGLEDRLPVAPVRRAEPSVGYRARTKLVAARGPRLGLYARTGDHEVLDIPDCRVLAPSLASVAAVIRQLMAHPPDGSALALEPLGEPGGRLRAVDLREVLDPDGATGVLVTLIIADELPRRGSRRASHRPNASATTSRHPAGTSDAPPTEPPTSAQALQAAAQAIRARAPEVRTVAVSWHRGASPQLLGSWPEVVVGPATVRDRLLVGAELFVHAAPGSFAQVHRGQASAIYERAAGWLELALGGLRGAPIVEAYAGTGGLGLLLASRGARVTMVESFAPAGRAAADAARAQRLDVQIRPGDAAAELGALAAEGAKPAAVVVNPTRSGLPSALRAACAELAPRAIVYLSCDPETLARDLADLERLGWRAERLEPFDMIPQTDQVETLAMLRVAAAPAPRLYHRADGLLVADKPPHEPAARAPHTSSLVDRVRAMEGCEQAVVVHGLGAATSGLCLLARSADDARRSTERFRASGLEQQYLVLARGMTRSKGAVRRGGRGPTPSPVGIQPNPAPADDREKARVGPVTRYRRLGIVGGHSLLLVSAEGARTEPLQRHLASIGHPVLGDARFGHEPSNRHLAQSHGLDRPFIHRLRLRLGASDDSPALEWLAPPPGDLRLVLHRLGGADAERLLDSLGDRAFETRAMRAPNG